MKPRVVEAKALQNHRLELAYETGERRIFDLTPWLDKGMFQALKDPALFATVQPFRNTVEWSNGADLDPDTLYEDSKPAWS